jgi:hypothetical protein
MDSPMFTLIDDEYHVIGGDEITFCGLPVPFANGYTNDRPDKVCAVCAKAALGETSTGKPTETEHEPLYATSDAPPEPEPAKAATSGKRTKA